MPRMARVVLPNGPHHVVQRGHNRQVVFAATEDYQRYLEDLRELKEQFGVRVYAYCLMTNHVHLLLAPGECTAGLSQLMKALAARATRYRNRLERRTGTLWESRFRSSPVQTEQYLLACTRYVELNPVRARIVSDPLEYPWSSYASRMNRLEACWLDRDPCYLALGESEIIRRMRYQEFVHQAIAPDEWGLIREALQRGQLTGSEHFAADVQRILGFRVERRGQGRPKLDERDVRSGGD